jgi:multiple antibiotic resistance protein
LLPKGPEIAVTLGVSDIVAILFITLGPLKATIVYAALTETADAALRRVIAYRTVAIATAVVLLFLLFGEFILRIFHISLAALKMAGGLILLLFALHMTIGEDRTEQGPKPAVTTAVAAYPLAIPLMATPQGIVAVVTFAAARPGISYLVLLIVICLGIMGLNLVALLSAGRLLAKSAGWLQAVSRVIGLLLAGLAIQLMILGLTDLGLIAPSQVH